MIVALILLGIIGWSLSITRTYIYDKRPAGFIRDLTPKEEAQLFLYQQTLKSELTYRDFAILKEIIRRESQWKPNALNINKNGSQDIGYFQINTVYWTDYARELNLEFWANWKDNIILGVLIYKNNGIHKWVSMR